MKNNKLCPSDICSKKVKFNFEVPLLALIIGIPAVIGLKIAFVCAMRRKHAKDIMNDVLDNYDLVPIDRCEDCGCEDENECDCGCESGK